MTSQTKPTFFEHIKQMMSSLEDGYDQLAPKFDQSAYVTPKGVVLPVFDTLKQEYKHFDKAIDICCGTGVSSEEMIKICDDFTAVDLSQGMLDQCQQKVEHQNGIPKRFIKGNALDLPFENEFDVAVSFGAFGHIQEKDKRTFVQQIHKVLKPGGVFSFVTTYHPHMLQWIYWRQKAFNLSMHIRNAFYSPKFIMYYLTFRLPEVQTLLESEGFEVTLYQDIFKNQKHDQTVYLIPTKEFVMVKAVKNSLDKT